MFTLHFEPKLYSSHFNNNIFIEYSIFYILLERFLSKAVLSKAVRTITLQYFICYQLFVIFVVVKLLKNSDKISFIWKITGRQNMKSILIPILSNEYSILLFHCQIFCYVYIFLVFSKQTMKKFFCSLSKL